MSAPSSALAIILLAPACGAFLLCLVPSQRTEWVRRIAVAATSVSLALAAWVITGYDRAAGGYQYQVFVPWIRTLGIGFHLGVDGISVVLVLLHALCGVTGVLISYAIKDRVKEYYIFYLLLITGVFGVFLSLDLFFFYFFYEMAVIPMYPLIGIWGSDVKDAAIQRSRHSASASMAAAPQGVVRFSKEYAAMKLTIYLTAGAVLALVGLLWLYVASGVRTFDIPELQRHFTAFPLELQLQLMIFPLLAVGFGVIAPMWPFHSWSPIGHAAAPSAVSMLHAGVLMKLGSYAIIRLAIGLLPGGAVAWLPWVAGLCTMNIIYGGLVAMAQKDLKLIIGYSSSSHMGYVLLGIAALTPLGMTGAVLLMFAHGLMTALAFALVGHVYDQTHTRYLPELGGLGKAMPFIATVGVIAAMASSGLPGFANFVAELLVILGAWDRYRLQAVLAVLGVVITSVYMLRLVRGTFFGALPKHFDHVHDGGGTIHAAAEVPQQASAAADARSWFARAPYLLLIAVLLAVGCWPGPMARLIDTSARPFVTSITGARR